MKKALVLAGIYWNDPLQRHQQFAIYLQKSGYEVFFVEHIVSTTFTIKKLLSVAKRLKKKKEVVQNRNVQNIKVINMGFVNPDHGVFDYINKKKVNNLIGMIGNEFDLVINYLPISTTRYILEKITYDKLIYDCVRNFSGWGEYSSSIELEENLLIEKSNKVFTDSYYLTDKMKEKTQKPVVQFLPIASESWKRGCYVGKNVERIKNIAYFGTVDKHIDTKILCRLVQGGYILHIWGKMSLELDFPYVYHGYVNDLEKLAKDVVQETEAIILPYRGNMDGVIPAKMMQCLQTKLPVYISRFYDSEKLGEFVYLYDGEEQLCESIANYNSVQHGAKINSIDCLMRNLDDECQYTMFCREI